MRKVIFILSMVSLLNICFANMPPLTPVKYSMVTKEEVKRHTKVSGRVVSKRVASVSPQVSGLVQKVHVEAGAWVKKDQVLLSLDDQKTQLSISEMKAQLKVNESMKGKLGKLLAIQKQEWKDLKLTEKDYKGSVSQKELRVEESKTIQLEGDLQEVLSQAQVLSEKIKQLELNLSYHQLKAPFAGQVLTKHISEGHWINLGTAVLDVIDSKNLEVQLDCPETLFESLVNGPKEVEVEMSHSGKSLSLKNMFLKSKVDLKTKTFQWCGSPVKVNSSLVEGMSVNAYIPSTHIEEAIIVDSNAILKNSVGSFVYKIIPAEKGEMVVPVQVKLGFRKGRKVIVTSPGLNAGDKVVVEGGERIFPMTPVSATEVK